MYCTYSYWYVGTASRGKVCINLPPWGAQRQFFSREKPPVYPETVDRVVGAVMYTHFSKVLVTSGVSRNLDSLKLRDCRNYLWRKKRSEHALWNLPLLD